MSAEFKEMILKVADEQFAKAVTGRVAKTFEQAFSEMLKREGFDDFATFMERDRPCYKAGFVEGVNWTINNAEHIYHELSKLQS